MYEIKRDEYKENHMFLRIKKVKLHVLSFWMILVYDHIKTMITLTRTYKYSVSNEENFDLEFSRYYIKVI